MWAWLTAALGVFFTLAVAVGLALGRVFATIGRQLAELEENELWASWQPPRRTEPQRRDAPTSTSVDSRSRVVGSSALVPTNSSNRRR